MATPPRTTGALTERTAPHLNGWLAIALLLVAAWFGFGWIVSTLQAFRDGAPIALSHLLAVIGAAALLLFVLKGLTILQPNTALVTTFFGRYAGTVRRESGGFILYNPLCATQRISLRLHNLLTPTLKVNDAHGNPIEVAAVIAWQVADTRRAAFAVEDYAGYIRAQSESALRQVAGTHPYDGEDPARTLRGNVAGVTRELMEAIESHVEAAGIRVVDARIAHLAYAPEIASAMLKRQQALQVVAARQTIVEGAVGMVETALRALEARDIVQLDSAQRAQLVTNLLTVLVGEGEAQPVLQMGANPAAEVQAGRAAG